MLVPSKTLKRTFRAYQWLSHSSGIFFFYNEYQFSCSTVNQLFVLYGSLGFSSYFFGHSWAKPFWPSLHPAYAFLCQGSFFGFYWPSLILWQKACEVFPFLVEPFCGLLFGHFFLRPSAIFEAKDLGPSLLCGTLFSVWRPLVYSIFILTAQLVSLFPQQLC